MVAVAFLSLARILGESSTIHSPSELVCLGGGGISSRSLISLFTLGSVHSGSARRDDCARVFPDEQRVSSFPDRFPHYARKAAQSSQQLFDIPSVDSISVPPVSQSLSTYLSQPSPLSSLRDIFVYIITGI